MRFFLYPTTFYTPKPIVNIANAVTPAIASDVIVRALTIALNPPILPPPVVPQPAYFVQQLDAQVVKPFAAAEQQFSAFAPVPPVKPVEGWRGPQLDQKLATPLPAQEQQWSGFEPAGFIQTTLPDGWRGLQLEARLVQPLAAAQQQWASFEPAGFIKTTLPDGWRGLQLETAFVKPLAPTQQQWAAFQPFVTTVVYPDGWRGLQLDSKIATPLPASQQQWSGFEPAGFIQTTLPDGWRGLQLETKFVAPLQPAQQQWAGFEPAGFIQTTLPDGWRGLQLEAKLVKPLAASEQQWSSFQPFGTVTVATTPSVLSEDSGIIVVTTTTIAGNQGLVAPPSSAPEGWRSLQLETKFATPVPAPQQKWDSYPPQGNVPTATTAHGWEGIQLERRLAAPFPAAEQQWAAFQPLGFIVTTPPFPEGWRGLQLDAKLIAPLPSAQQQWASFEPRGAIFSTTPQGWWGWQLDSRFAAPVPIAQQQFSGFYPFGRITPAEGWRGLQLDTPFFKAPAPAQQQWGTFTPLPPAATTTTPQGWRAALDSKFAVPFPAPAQQWASFIQAPAVFALATVQSGDVSANLITIADDQEVIGPLTTVVVTFKDGWRGLQLDAKLAKPVAAAQQQWASFEPQGTIVSTPPTIFAGAAFGSSDVFCDTLVIATNQPVIGLLSTVAPPVVAGATWNSSDVFVDSLVIATNQPTIQPIATTATVYAGGTWDSSDVFVDTLVIATNQQPLPPIATTATTTPQGWRGLQLDAQIAKPFPVTEQQWLTFIDVPVVYALAAISSGDVSAALRTIAIDQPTIPPLVTATFKEGWRGLQLEARFKTPLSAAEQQWSGFEPAGFIKSTTPYGWWGIQLDYRLAKPFPIALQQYAGLYPPQGSVPSPVRPFGAIRQDPLIVGYSYVVEVEGSGAFAPSFTPPASFAKWGWQLDSHFAQPFPVADQQFAAINTPRGIPTATTPHGWEGVQLDFRLAKPFPAAIQQFLASFTPLGTIATATIAQGAIRQDPLIVSYGYVVEFDGSGGFAPSFAARPGFTSRWDLELRFAKPFPVADQLFSTSLAPTGTVPTAKTAHGWESWQLNAQLAKTFPVVAQQFVSSFTPRGMVPTGASPHGWEGWQLNIRFAQPFPIHDQQFVSWPAELVPFFPPPGSGRRYKPPTEYLLTVPPAWDVKQRKPIKPIWDRGGKVEKPQEPPKPRTPPPVPASIFEPEPAPLSLTSLPTFGQYTIDRPLKLADHMKNVRLHTAYDRDEQAMVLILDRLIDEDEEEEE